MNKPFGDFANELIEVYQATGSAPATVAKMVQVLREVSLLPRVKLVSDLTPLVLAAYARRCRHRSPATTRGLFSYLRAACGYAARMKYLEVNPFTSTRLSQWCRSENQLRLPIDRHHTLDQIAAVLDHLAGRQAQGWADHRLYALVATVAYTGVRKNEALHAQVQDVDIELGVLEVVARRRLKTHASAQPVPLPDRLLEVLRDWIPRTGSIWLFPTLDRQHPWTGGMPGRKPLDQLKAAGLAAGVPAFTFLSLRHSWATHAEAWGFGELLVQRVLRHARPTTQRHYRHADLANLRRQVAAIDLSRPLRPRAAAVCAEADLGVFQVNAG